MACREKYHFITDGRAVLEIKPLKRKVADEKNILVVEVQNITQEMPLYGLYKAKWQIAIIFDRTFYVYVNS